MNFLKTDIWLEIETYSFGIKKNIVINEFHIIDIINYSP